MRMIAHCIATTVVSMGDLNQSQVKTNQMSDIRLNLIVQSVEIRVFAYCAMHWRNWPALDAGATGRGGISRRRPRGDWAMGNFCGPLGNETRAWLALLATGRPSIHRTPKRAMLCLKTTHAIGRAAATGRRCDAINFRTAALVETARSPPAASPNHVSTIPRPRRSERESRVR